MDVQATTVPRRPLLSSGILLVGALAYAALCVPAIRRRGYPPIDHFWMAMPYLWVGPLVLSALFDRGASRRRWLIAYSLFTGFVDAATTQHMVPRHVTLVGTLFETLLLFGPLHLLVTFVVEVAFQAVFKNWRSFGPATANVEWRPRLSLFEFLVAIFLISLMAAFPATYRQWMVTREHTRGREIANRDWAQHNAIYYSDSVYDPIYLPDGTHVEYEYDRETGLRSGFPRPPRELRNAYRERINELLGEQGIPKWSVKALLLSPEELAARLNDPAGMEITSLPYEVTPSIVVFRSGTLSKWGSTMTVGGTSSGITSSGTGPAAISSRGNGLSIAMERDGLLGVGSGQHPIYVLDAGPETVLIRHGTNWIGLFHRDGRLLQSASR
ncbi:MAG: hypothetical protein JNG90_16930 [Planctomycetaceae bacterium]|nr:hypothetical protein [Planctomycetaceae bacterium]